MLAFVHKVVDDFNIIAVEFALYELIRAVKEVGSEDAAETLETLVQGKRLKDISDLPLDLAV